MEVTSNKRLISLSSIIGKRVGNNPNNVTITQDMVKKNGGPFDSNVHIRRKKFRTIINSNR
jgi:hypothetical protein